MWVERYFPLPKPPLVHPGRFLCRGHGVLATAPRGAHSDYPYLTPVLGAEPPRTVFYARQRSPREVPAGRRLQHGPVGLTAHHPFNARSLLVGVGVSRNVVERVLGAKHVNRMFNHRIAVMLGFKQFRNAAITIAGIELMDRI